MNKKVLNRLFILFIINLPLIAVAQNQIDLSGKWEFRIDRENKGLEQSWYNQTFTDKVNLPGCLQEQGYGNDVTIDTKWWAGATHNSFWLTSPIYEKYRQPGNIKIFSFLQPDKEYIGVAWYKKTVTVPREWDSKRVVLFLERAHWETTLWINGTTGGTQNSLGTEHVYDLTGLLKPGNNTIVLRIDNSQIVNLGSIPHSVSDETQTAWNGIIGKMDLLTTEKTWIDDVQIYPDIKNKKIRIDYTICKKDPGNATADISFSVKGRNLKNDIQLPVKMVKVELNSDSSRFSYEYPMGTDVQLWDEFNPNLYELTVSLVANSKGQFLNSSLDVVFGMREIKVRGTMFEVNGNLISLRGNVNCAIFPAKGYPYMDVEWWRGLWKKYKDWGINDVRFHSWCPPREAFIAADEIGIYLQPEVSEWATINTPVQEAWFTKESLKMLKAYGNSPSFTMMELGNEDSADSLMMKRFIAIWKKDPRHLYSGKPNGSPKLSVYDYSIECWLGPIRTRYQFGWPPRPLGTLFNSLAPQTTVDFSEAVEKAGRPLISHENGARCVYPNITKEIPKYKGLLKPTYLEIGRDQLIERGMLDQLPDFVKASGLWQVQQYKEEIEAHLRTPGYAGFQLLSLEDFTGQGSAPVGLLDPFYDTRGYVEAPEFRKFCNKTVVLAKIKKRVLTSTDTLNTAIVIYNYSGAPVNAEAIVWEIRDQKDNIVHTGKLPGRVFPKSDLTNAGYFRYPVKDLKASAKYKLIVSVKGTPILNDWDFWIFPTKVEEVPTNNLVISKKIDENVFKALKEGKTVVVFGNQDSTRGALPICFSGYYWSTFGMNGGESSAMSLLCNPSHPLFDFFPSDMQTNWQWWDILTRTHPMILNEYQGAHPFPFTYKPTIQLIDSWLINRKLAALIEGKVENGKIIITSMDLSNDLDSRPAARQLRYSLLKYATSAAFNPTAVFTEDMIKDLFVDSSGSTLKN